MAKINLLVATDSSSDDDDMGSIDGYIIYRNPRFKSPEPSPGNPFSTLDAISSHQDLILYLDTHRHVSYRHHVLDVQVLLNAIVNAYNIHVEVLGEESTSSVGALGDEDGSSTTLGTAAAHTHLALHTDLFNSFITFYSIGKMRRSF